MGRYVFTATYFNNLFHDQINYVTVDPVNFIGEYVNVNKALAQGAEVGHCRRSCGPRLLLNTAYTYTSSEYPGKSGAVSMRLYDPGQPSAAAAETLGDGAVVLFGIAVGSESGRKFCGTAAGLGFSRVRD